MQILCLGFFLTKISFLFSPLNSDRDHIPREVIHENAKALKKQMERIAENVSLLYGAKVNFSIKNNLDWYKEVLFLLKLISTISFQMRVLDFFESIKKIRMNDMLKSGPVKSRLDANSSLSYVEFSYQALQAIDWLRLAQDHDCLCQVKFFKD